MRPRIWNFVFITKVLHRAKGILFQKAWRRWGGVSPHRQLSSLGCSTPWLTSGRVQGAEAWAAAHTAHPGCPALPGAATACHVPPGENVHTPTNSFCIIPWKVLSFGHWAPRRAALCQWEDKKLDWHLIGFESQIHSCKKDDLLNIAAMSTWLQTFKQEMLHPKTGQLILYVILDTQTYR